MKVNVGYARISTKYQNIQNQITLLKGQDANIKDEHIFTDADIGGAVKAMDRPGYKQMKQMIDAGLVDTVYVTEISRIGRISGDALREVLDIEKKGTKVYFISQSHKVLNEADATYKPMLLSAMALAADIERQETSERTKIGLHRARINGSKSGKPIGRPETQIDWKKVDEFKAKGISQRAICRFLGFSEVTFYRKLKERESEQKQANVVSQPSQL
jgi:DNA invertase Pin-like site-specific DNA recombinase